MQARRTRISSHVLNSISPQTLFAGGTSAVAGCTTQHPVCSAMSASHWAADTPTILERYRGGQTNTQSITQDVNLVAIVPNEHLDVAQKDDVQRGEVRWLDGCRWYGIANPGQQI